MTTSLFASTGPRPVLAASGLTLAYGRRTVLHNVAFTVMPGEFWFIIGPNGAGKSTLVKAMLGLLAPTAGSLALARELDDRQRLGFVPQRLAMSETVPMTVREFVDLGSTGLTLTRGERQRRLVAALERTGIADLTRRDLRELSGGQRQRALIPRALVREPLMLVVDEPTTGLDPVAEQGLMEVLATLHHSGLTVVFVAHDLAMVAERGSHVALVAGGTVRTGTAAEVLTTATLSAAFGVPMTVQRTAVGTFVQVGVRS